MSFWNFDFDMIGAGIIELNISLLLKKTISRKQYLSG
jgi:hypothetical protein